MPHNKKVDIDGSPFMAYENFLWMVRAAYGLHPPGSHAVIILLCTGCGHESFLDIGTPKYAYDKYYVNGCTKCGGRIEIVFNECGPDDEYF